MFVPEMYNLNLKNIYIGTTQLSAWNNCHAQAMLLFQKVPYYQPFTYNIIIPIPASNSTFIYTDTGTQ